MATSDFSRIKKRAIAVLLANPSSYAAVVSGDVGRYLDTQEFIDAALQRDAELFNAGLETPGHWIRNQVAPTLSTALTNGSQLPAMQGAISSVVVSHTSGGTYAPAKLAESKDQISAILEDVTLFGADIEDTEGWAFIEDGRIYTTSPFVKVNYYTFTISTSPQCPEVFEDAIAQGVISTLFKDGSLTPEIHSIAEQKFQNKLAEIRAYPGRLFPEVQTAEMQTAK